MSSRGYGFISIDDSEKDVFFHMSNFPPREIPVQDQSIEFEIKETPKGKEAVNIKIVGDEPEEEQVPEPVEEVVTPPASESHGLDELSGVGPKYRALLEKADITTCEELVGKTPEKLLADLLAVNEKEQITKRPPTEAKVKEWIDKASEVVA